MALNIFAPLLMGVLGIHIAIQAYGITNHTRIIGTISSGFSVQGNTVSDFFDKNTDTYPQKRTLLATHDLSNALYISASIFMPNYQQMIENFKIYIYPPKQQDFGSPEWCSSQKFRNLDRSGVMFYETLVSSKFITDDPEKAHLFFVPFAVDALRLNSSIVVARFLRRYIDDLRADYPYWDRTLGADHFYVSCDGVDIDSSRNVVELKKNAIQVSCYPLPVGGNARFYPHKDINMPPIDSVKIAHQTQSFYPDEMQRRTILAYCVSSLELIPGLDSIFDLWKTDPDFVLDPLLLEPALHAHRLASSRFCLNFLGVGGNSSTLLNALAFGCIPVIISDGPIFDLPFQDVLNWKEFSVIVNMRQVSKLKNILQNMSEVQYQKMHILTKEASKHFKWHSTPRPYEAFYTVMYQLWLRRHTIRYARRHVSS
eukprot:Gb_38509 [translate_table: standard]